jgi:hypothetical protein
VVSTPFAELQDYHGLVRVASGAAEFTREVQASVRSCLPAERMRSRVREDTWTAKAAVVVEELRHAGIRLSWPKSLMKKGDSRRIGTSAGA